MTDPNEIFGTTESRGAAPAATGQPEQAARYNGKSVIGLIAGVISLLLLLLTHASLISLVLGIVAVVLGHLGQREIRATNELSRPLACAALGTGYGSIAISLLLTIAALTVAAGAADGGGDVPDACTNSTGHFSHEQLQKCFDQTDD